MGRNDLPPHTGSLCSAAALPVACCFLFGANKFSVCITVFPFVVLTGPINAVPDEMILKTGVKPSQCEARRFP